MRIETIALHPLTRRSLGDRLALRLLNHYAKGISLAARVAHNVTLRRAENICIGEGSIVGFGCELHAWGSIRIGRCVIISPHCVILTGSHELQTEQYGEVIEPVIVDDYAWIAYGSIILPGVRVGYGAVVGAGSVVTKDVEPWSIVAGNPARHVKWRPERDLTYIPAEW